MARVSREDIALLLLRVGLAALMVGVHGWTRLHRAIGYIFYHQQWTFVSVVERLGFPLPGVFAVLSAGAESIVPLVMAIGLFTRWSAAIIAINMAVALANEAFKGDSFELPGLFLLGAVTIMLLGPGGLSVDGWRRRR